MRNALSPKAVDLSAEAVDLVSSLSPKPALIFPLTVGVNREHDAGRRNTDLRWRLASRKEICMRRPTANWQAYWGWRPARRTGQALLHQKLKRHGYLDLANE
jgi:hypothetical protein